MIDRERERERESERERERENHRDVPDTTNAQRIDLIYPTSIFKFSVFHPYCGVENRNEAKVSA